MIPDRLEMFRTIYNDPDWKPLPLCAMNAMVKYGRVELLSHPLSQKFLEFKWHSYGMYFHLAHLLFYLLFLASVTLFAVKIMSKETDGFPPDGHFSKVNESTNDSHPNVSESESGIFKEDRIHDSSCVYAIFVLLFVSFGILRELTNLIRHKQRYFGEFCNHTCHWAMYVTCLVMTLNSVSDPPIFEHKDSLSFTAMAVFLAWFNLLVYIQRFDRIGIYVVMFLEILKTLLKVLLVFSVLFIAFGLAFYILLSPGNHIGFRYIPLALFRTFSMMLGEIDFLGTFVRPLSELKTEDVETNLQMPLTSHLMLLLFMILMPILLMNLLIGLAVGDIEAVRRNAQLKRLAMQVELHTDLERKLPHFFMQRVNKMEIMEYPNKECRKKGFLEFCKCLVADPYLDNDLLPSDTATDGVLEELETQKRKLRDITSTLESQTHLLRLIIQKMEIKTEADDFDEGSNVGDSQLSLVRWPAAVRRKQLMRRTATIGGFRNQS